MKMASLFDGISGFPLASIRSGIEPVWSSEIEKFPMAVSEIRFPNMKQYGDITKINGDQVEPVDIITFGSPCQDLSVAGKRAGMQHTDKGDEETTRSGLFMEAVRIIKEMRNATRLRNTNDECANVDVREATSIASRSTRDRVCSNSGGYGNESIVRSERRRDTEVWSGDNSIDESRKAGICSDNRNATGSDINVRPRFAVWENVPGAYSSNKGEDFRVVLEELARVKEAECAIPQPANNKWLKSGNIVGNGWSIAWRTLDAQFWGVPQRRRRIFLVCDFGGQSASKILFKREGLSRNFAESREAREGIAEGAERCVDSSVYNESGRGYWMPGYGCLRADGGFNNSNTSHAIVDRSIPILNFQGR
jgi:site-specific DNA-cytosine methylase